MVAPKAPEGGWRRWFLDHPYQRTKYPILRSPSVDAVFYDYQLDEAGNMKPWAEPRYDYVEMWHDSGIGKVFASFNGMSADWIDLTYESNEATWSLAVESLFDYVMHKDKEQTPPEPSGSGWDDFDWSI